MRDNFNSKTKEILASRVGYRCSNPRCGILTKGPNFKGDSFVNVGVAAHITAAAKGGPRYDDSLSVTQRKSIKNGIWLCQSCSKLIDSDTDFYTKELLNYWKKISEKLAEFELKNPRIQIYSDEEFMKFYSICFSRPAFTHYMVQEGSCEDLYQAINDTIIAIDTGYLFSRDGKLIEKLDSYSAILNEDLALSIKSIRDLLSAIKDRFIIEKNRNRFFCRENYYCFDDKEFLYWFDSTRKDILAILNNLFIKYNLDIEIKMERRKQFF